MRLITVSFSIYSKAIDIKEIDRIMGIPDAELWYPPLPQYIDPAWNIDIYSTDISLEPALVKLESVLEPKMDYIMALCRQDGIKSTVVIQIKAECYAARPIISIPVSFFSFFEKLNAEVSFNVLYGEDLAGEYLADEISDIWKNKALKTGDSFTD